MALRLFIIFPSLKEVCRVSFLKSISRYIDGNYLSFSLGAYRCEILNSEFMFSDQLATVISGLYGPDVAEVLSFPNFFLFAYIVIYLAHSLLC